MNIVGLIITSIGNYLSLLREDTLHLRKSRLGKKYLLRRYGTYQVFRETESTRRSRNEPVVLVVGFRLRFINSNPFFHWLFQRVCLLTTPFWSGFKGFHIKLWMVDPTTKNYLGIYEWYGEENTLQYVKTLVTVLKPLSTKNSVWYKIFVNQMLEDYLKQHQV